MHVAPSLLLASAVCAAAACAPVDDGLREGEGEGEGGEGAGEGEGEDGGEAGPCDPLPAGVSFGARGVLDRARGPSAGRVVLMGGGVEVDRGSTLFVEGALGGDVLVLRASGSTESYTSYFAEVLDVEPAPASVTTLLLDDPALAAHPSVLCHVDGAEAVWLAGGDQAAYLVHWPDALRDALARAADDGVTLGGTSAGAMSLSALAFDALHGSVTSEEALADPNDALVRVVPSPFSPAAMAGTLVDTHFVARNREGRLLAFLDRALVDGAARVVGVGLDEHGTALVVHDGTFDFLADDGATGLAYEAVGPEAPESGALDLDGVARITLTDGDRGPWPLSFAGADVLDVVDGAIAVR